MRYFAALPTLAFSVALVACESREASGYVHIGPDTLPSESYVRPPAVAHSDSDYVIKLENMTSFYDMPGEAGYGMDGADYGFQSLSFIMTETHPGGGPPLHTHE